MDPFTIMALAGATKGVFDIAGAIIGNSVSGRERDRARELAEQAYEKILAVGAPPDLAKKIFFQEFKSAGMLTPQVMEAIETNLPKIVSYKEDPSLKKAQTEALATFSQMGKLGETPEERAQRLLGLREAERTVAAESARQQQEMAARGMGESGAAIAARFASADRARQLASEQALRGSAEARSRSLEAMTRASDLGTKLREQEFGFAREKSAAEAEMDRFNVGQRSKTQEYNLGQKAEAQKYNLQEQQRIMDANIQLRNQELLRQRQAQGTDWQNKLNWAQSQSGAQMGQSQLAAQQAAQTQQMYQSIFGGLGSIAQAGMGAWGQSAAANQASTALSNLGSRLGPQFAGIDFSALSQLSPDDRAALLPLLFKYGIKR